MNSEFITAIVQVFEGETLPLLGLFVLPLLLASPGKSIAGRRCSNLSSEDFAVKEEENDFPRPRILLRHEPRNLMKSY